MIQGFQFLVNIGGDDAIWCNPAPVQASTGPSGPDLLIKWPLPCLHSNAPTSIALHLNGPGNIYHIVSV